MKRRAGSDGAAGGPSGPDGAPEGSVHQSCTDTGQSSDPSSPVGSCRAKTGFRLSHIGVRLIYGPIRDHTGP